MTSTATTPDEYIAAIPEDRQAAMTALRNTFRKYLPKGFEERMQYGMITYVVPHSLYPAGYHCKPEEPLPLVSIASQKNFIAIYHMGIYSSPELLEWFTTEYPKHSSTKLDMGKSCIRFKKPEQIPMELIAQLAKKMTPKDWIARYESILDKK